MQGESEDWRRLRDFGDGLSVGVWRRRCVQDAVKRPMLTEGFPPLVDVLRHPVYEKVIFVGLVCWEIQRCAPDAVAILFEGGVGL